MKSLILFPLLYLLIQSQIYNDGYKAIVKNITVSKSLEVKSQNKNEMIAKLKEIIPSHIFTWLENASEKRLNSKSNIDLSYDKKEGGKANGELYYFNNKIESNQTVYTFYYGIAEAELGPVTKIKRKQCRWRNRRLQCFDHYYTPVIEEDKLKSFLSIRMREAIYVDIKKKKSQKNVQN